MIASRMPTCSIYSGIELNLHYFQDSTDLENLGNLREFDSCKGNVGKCQGNCLL